MERKSVAQEYYVLAVNKAGNMPAMNINELNAGLIVAEVIDLSAEKVISVEKKKIAVIKELPGELSHLAPLYDYLGEKPRSTDKLMGDYAMSGKKMRELTASIGESLAAAGLADKEEGGLFGGKTVYIPKKAYKDELVDTLKAVAFGEDEWNPRDVALIAILAQTKILNQYFSKYEREDFKARLKEIKRKPENKQWAEMIAYVDTMTTAMATVTVMMGSV